ncbi:MAG: glycosyltransferase [Planctomycetota bacterium]
MLLVTYGNILSRTQLFPFHLHRRSLERQHGIEMREMPLDELDRAAADGGGYGSEVDAVALQTGFDLGDGEMRALLGRVQRRFPRARLVYLDWFAPLDLRYAPVLADHVVVYVKKQVFKNPADYGRPTLGDTNLTDHYARRFGLDYPQRNGPSAERLLDKLVLGSNLLCSPQLLPRFMGPRPDGPRSIDLHARIRVDGGEWYTRMRQEALDRVQALRGVSTACQGLVGRKQYQRELLDSRLCLSPFGYGEVCWRDYEAICAGSLLLKPDMSHVSCVPDIFVSGETYVPLNWDLSDLEEKVRYYLEHEPERQAIVQRAFEVCRRHLEHELLHDHLHPLLRRIVRT